jgi:hypothetical protein
LSVIPVPIKTLANTASVFIGTRITYKTFTRLGYVSNTASVFIGTRITDKTFTGLGYKTLAVLLT